MILFSQMITFLAYAMQVVIGFVMLVFVFVILPRAIVSAKRIEEILDTEPSIKDGNVTESPGTAKGEIVFSNVGFKYPGASDYVLKDVSFKAERGETVAFIGSTGSGKSTIIHLIMRSYDVTEGKVSVDGVDVRDYTQKALHRKIGYVPQKANLFSGTISSNVTYGDSSAERTEEDAEEGDRDRPGHGVRGEDGGRLQRRDIPGRDQPLRGPEAASLHRPGGVPEAGDLHLRRFVLRSGLSGRTVRSGAP